VVGAPTPRQHSITITEIVHTHPFAAGIAVGILLDYGSLELCTVFLFTLGKTEGFIWNEKLRVNDEAARMLGVANGLGVRVISAAAASIHDRIVAQLQGPHTLGQSSRLDRHISRTPRVFQIGAQRVLVPDSCKR
jgi:hypothetical protein